MTLPASTIPISAAMLSFSLEKDALRDRIVVITGATGGLGTALSRACTSAGATVVLIGKSVEKLEALYDVLESIPGAAQPAIIPVNQEVATEADYLQLADMLKEEFGQIDALVHTAAELGVVTPMPAIPQAQWTKVMSINFTSARLLTMALLPLLGNSDNASIVFTLDKKPGAYWGPYGVSKDALKSMANMLFDETSSQFDEQGNPKLAINTIDPGPMRTPLRRRAFPGELESESAPPEEQLGAFLALLSRSDKKLNGANVTHHV